MVPKDLIPPDLVETLRAARSIVVLTGAGVSQESGIPTFRDAMEGLWARYDPSQLATPEAFRRDPQTVTQWYDWRRQKCAGARPNPAHLALARFEQHCRKTGRNFTLVTQNVDRLHQSAGNTGVLELHGTLWVWRCAQCGREREERGEPFETYPPRCSCGGNRRPAVTWFGELLPPDALAAADRAVDTCDLFFSIGTSAVVYPAASLAHAAGRRGAGIVEINPQPTPLTKSAVWSLFGKAGEILPLLIEKAVED